MGSLFLIDCKLLVFIVLAGFLKVVEIQGKGPGGLKFGYKGKTYSFSTETCDGGVFFKKPIILDYICPNGYFLKRSEGCSANGEDIVGAEKYVCTDYRNKKPKVQALIPFTNPENPMDHTVALYDDQNLLKGFRRYTISSVVNKGYVPTDNGSSFILVANPRKTQDMSIGKLCYKGTSNASGSAYKVQVQSDFSGAEANGFFSRGCKKTSVNIVPSSGLRYELMDGIPDLKRFSRAIEAKMDPLEQYANEGSFETQNRVKKDDADEKVFIDLDKGGKPGGGGDTDSNKSDGGSGGDSSKPDGGGSDSSKPNEGGGDDRSKTDGGGGGDSSKPDGSGGADSSKPDEGGGGDSSKPDGSGGTDNAGDSNSGKKDNNSDGNGGDIATEEVVLPLGKTDTSDEGASSFEMNWPDDKTEGKKDNSKPDKGGDIVSGETDTNLNGKDNGGPIVGEDVILPVDNGDKSNEDSSESTGWPSEEALEGQGKEDTSNKKPDGKTEDIKPDGGDGTIKADDKDKISTTEEPVIEPEPEDDGVPLDDSDLKDGVIIDSDKTGLSSYFMELLTIAQMRVEELFGDADDEGNPKPPENDHSFLDDNVESSDQSGRKSYRDTKWFQILSGTVEVTKSLLPSSFPIEIYSDVLRVFGYMLRYITDHDTMAPFEDSFTNIIAALEKCKSNPERKKPVYAFRNDSCPEEMNDISVSGYVWNDTVESYDKDVPLEFKDVRSLKEEDTLPPFHYRFIHTHHIYVEMMWMALDIAYVSCFDDFKEDLNSHSRMAYYLTEYLFVNEDVYSRWMDKDPLDIGIYLTMMPNWNGRNFEKLMWEQDVMRAAIRKRAIPSAWMRPDKAAKHDTNVPLQDSSADEMKRTKSLKSSSPAVQCCWDCKCKDNRCKHCPPIVLDDENQLPGPKDIKRKKLKRISQWGRNNPKRLNNVVSGPNGRPESKLEWKRKRRDVNKIGLKTREIWNGLAYCMSMEQIENSQGQIKQLGLQPPLETFKSELLC